MQEVTGRYQRHVVFTDRCILRLRLCNPHQHHDEVVADLKQFGTVQRALLGITGTTLGTDLQMDERLAEEMKKKADELGVKEGVLIAEVVEGGSAAGVLKSDDVIVGIDGKKVHKFTDLQEVLAKHRPGDKVKVKVIRDKKEKEFVLTLKNSQGNTK